MDARTQRTVIRVGSLLGALVVTILILTFVPNLDPRAEEAILGLAITAAMGLDQWIKNSGDNAAPTIAAVNQAIQPDTPNVVPPPSEPTPK